MLAGRKRGTGESLQGSSSSSRPPGVVVGLPSDLGRGSHKELALVRHGLHLKGEHEHEPPPCPVKGRNPRSTSGVAGPSEACTRQGQAPNCGRFLLELSRSLKNGSNHGKAHCTCSEAAAGPCFKQKPTENKRVMVASFLPLKMGGGELRYRSRGLQLGLNGREEACVNVWGGCVGLLCSYTHRQPLSSLLSHRPLRPPPTAWA